MKNGLPSLTATAGNSCHGLAIYFNVMTLSLALAAFTFRFINPDNV